MTKTELIEQRAAAGAAYATAAASYFQAWVTLHAFDLVAGNRNVRAVSAERCGAPQQPTLAGHPEFLRGDVLTQAAADPGGRARNLAAAMLDSLSA